MTIKLGTLIGIIFCYVAGDLAYAQSTYLPGMLLGRGYDAQEGKVKEDCMSFEKHPEPEKAIAEANWGWDEVTSNSDLLEALEVDAKASLKLGGFGGSAEINLLSKHKLSAFSANVLASARTGLRWEYTTMVNLKGPYEKLVIEKPDEFRKRCGTQYVSGIFYGGTFYTMITIETSSQSDLDEVSAAVSASYGPFEASGKLDKKTEEAISNRRKSIIGYGTGLGTDGTPLSFDELNSRWANFNKEVQTSGGAPIKVQFAEYPTTQFSESPQLNHLITARWDFVSLIAELEYISGHQDQFYMDINTWGGHLDYLREQAETSLQQLDVAIDQCSQDQSQCSLPGEIGRADDIREELPPRYISVCGPQTLNLSHFIGAVDRLPLCRGDKEMAGNNPTITIQAKLTPEEGGELINLKTTVDIYEAWYKKPKKRTLFCGERESTVAMLETPGEWASFPGCYIHSPSDLLPRTGRLQASGGKSRNEYITYNSGSGFIKSADCQSDTSGKDDGETGCRNIRFHDIKIELSHDEEKMGPNERQQSASHTWERRATIKGKIARSKQARWQSIRDAYQKTREKTGKTFPKLLKPLGLEKGTGSTLPPLHKTKTEGLLNPGQGVFDRIR